MKKTLLPAGWMATVLCALVLALVQLHMPVAHASEPVLSLETASEPGASIVILDQTTQAASTDTPSMEPSAGNGSTSIQGLSGHEGNQSNGNALQDEGNTAASQAYTLTGGVYPIDGFSLGTIEAGYTLSLGVPMQIVTETSSFATNTDASGNGVNFAPQLSLIHI